MPVCAIRHTIDNGSVRVGLHIPDELLARVDEARGDVSRSRWVRRALEEKLGESDAEVERARTELRETLADLKPRVSRVPPVSETWRR